VGQAVNSERSAISEPSRSVDTHLSHGKLIKYHQPQLNAHGDILRADLKVSELQEAMQNVASAKHGSDGWEKKWMWLSVVAHSGT
jgi:hypothetical protein